MACRVVHGVPWIALGMFILSMPPAFCWQANTFKVAEDSGDVDIFIVHVAVIHIDRFLSTFPSELERRQTFCLARARGLR